VGVEILTNFCFLGHNFGSTYARKPIKGFKDSDDSLISSETLRQNIGLLDWRLRLGKVGLKNAKKLLVTSLLGNPKPKTEKFFSVETRSLAESVDGLNTSLSLSTDELWLK